jgi:probable HAF family extracellular repeat protein
LTQIGNQTSDARDINEYGQAVGNRSGPNGVVGYLWTPKVANGMTGMRIDLAGLAADPEPPGRGRAFAINPSGQVTGQVSTSTGQLHAFLWNPGSANATSGSMSDLGVVTYGDVVGGTGINEYGQVAWVSGSDDSSRTFLWTPQTPRAATGTSIDLGHRGIARINGYGQVLAGGLWTPSAPNGTQGTYDTSVSGVAINDQGQVVNRVANSLVRWTPSAANGTSGATTTLATFPGGNFAWPTDMNDLGAIVGYQASGGTATFVWTAAEGLVDLNTVLDESGGGWLVQEAYGINNLGQIVGTAEFGGGRLHAAVILTPTSLLPEPSGMVSLAIGVVLLRRRGRRRFGA